jgi:outer membrane protein assembly factor BamE (lipoprotein component of BamABCDE complex)
MLSAGMFESMIPLASVTRYPALRFFALSLGLIALTACNIPSTQRGNLPKPDALDQIKPGVTDKQTVTRLLGTPSSTAAFDTNTWYYISHETKQVAFLEPTLLDQQVVAIRFDDNGIVVGIDRKGMGDAQTITPNPNATPAQGREYTFLEQLIGNFGKFNSDKDNGTPGGPKTGRDGS